MSTERPAPPSSTAGWPVLVVLLTILGGLIWVFWYAFVGSVAPSPDAEQGTSGDSGVVAAMRSCTDDVMDTSQFVDGAESAPQDALAGALRTTLGACATSKVPATWTCDTDGCFDAGGTGYTWTDQARSWACRNVSSDYC